MFCKLQLLDTNKGYGISDSMATSEVMDMGHELRVLRLQSKRSANKSVCAPEPYDVGRILQVDIISNAQKSNVTTVCPIQPVTCSMGNRKSRAKPAPLKRMDKLDTVFSCPFCNHGTSVECRIDVKNLIGEASCRIC
ncbi:putative transcription elongation factor 1 [Helianthus annuus]|nr:putative transcription elongation factor 1 [Helianthus annuus]KAJ0548897.1 putative transcription elongation factor 1 [Helianthus annuus]KAJ0555122.1 putative transcription elongation factor 1 [Helianthus annuus]KAJ0720689.1 putative transcription elongation factor 1 [Helianthus annuus]KAJ0723871.1 putative transcription elongation factor 1 [Helianthus annuus]